MGRQFGSLPIFVSLVEWADRIITELSQSRGLGVSPSHVAS